MPKSTPAKLAYQKAYNAKPESIKRREDPRLVTGHGRFVDDVVVPGMLHAAFVRSDLARAVEFKFQPLSGIDLPNSVTILRGKILDKTSWLDDLLGESSDCSINSSQRVRSFVE